MSFKILTLQLTGKLKPVDVIEKKREKLRKDYEEFLDVEKSEELEKLLGIEARIRAGEFKKKKEELKALVFKGSREYSQLKEFEALKKKSSIKNYFKVEGSPELKRYEGLKDSAKLNEYFKLLDYIQNGEFEKEKAEIKRQVFKGSVEEKHLRELQQLEKSAGIKAYLALHNSQELKKHIEFTGSEKLKTFLKLKNTPAPGKEMLKEYKKLKADGEIRSYFRFEKSKKLKLYHETVGSHDLKRFEELKNLVEQDEFKEKVRFLKDRKKFEKSEAFKKQEAFKKLKSDDDIRFFLKFEKSALYKNYLDVADSFELKRYHELKEIIGSEEYRKRRAYLEDKNKWEKTEECALEKEYERMKKLPHLVKYFKYNGTDAFRFFEEWETVFEDDFSAGKIDTEKWSFTTLLADKMLGDNYSADGDLQVYTRGENVKANGKLVVEARKEKKTGKMWKPATGFVQVELDYTSGLVSSWKSFWMEDGIIEAKVKFNPDKQLVSSVALCGEKNMPRVNLVEMGVKNRVGILKLDARGKARVEGEDISNLKKGSWYIFTLERKGNRYSWKINDADVFSATNAETEDKQCINVSTIVVEAMDVPLHTFEIAWIKSYRRK